MELLNTNDASVEVGVDSHTENIEVQLRMESTKSDPNFDYHVDIDDFGQIVITPNDVNTSFTSIHRKNFTTEVDTEGDGIKVFTISLTATMLAEDENFEYFLDIDEIGQAIITPESDTTSFLTVSVNDSLNLVTEVLNEADENATKRDIVLRVVEDLEKGLQLCIEKASRIVDDFRKLSIDGGDIEKELIEPLRLFIENKREGEPSCSEFRRLIEASKPIILPESLLEELAGSPRNKLLHRFMMGDVTIIECEECSDNKYEPLEELDTVDYKYFYDSESDVIACCPNKEARVQYKGAVIYPVNGGFEANLKGFHYEDKTFDGIKSKIDKAISTSDVENTIKMYSASGDFAKPQLFEDAEDNQLTFKAEYSLEDGDVETVSLEADSFDSAVKYALQYVRKMQLDDSTAEKWTDAKLLSLE